MVSIAGALAVALLLLAADRFLALEPSPDEANSRQHLEQQLLLLKEEAAVLVVSSPQLGVSNAGCAPVG